MPAPAIADWQPAQNPYLRRWTVAGIPKLRAQYSLMQRLVRGLRDAGVPLLAGTDDMVPSQLPGFAMKDELEQLEEAALTPFEALQTATRECGALPRHRHQQRHHRAREDGGPGAPRSGSVTEHQQCVSPSRRDTARLLAPRGRAPGRAGRNG